MRAAVPPADCRELALPVPSVQVLRPSLKAGGVAFVPELNSTSDCDKQVCSWHPWCSLSAQHCGVALLKC